MSKKKKIPSIINEIKQHIPKEINYAGGEKGISFSQFQMYNECPKKWELNYKEGLRVPSFSINMSFGTAIHTTIQNYLTVYYNESGNKADEIDLHSYFQDEFAKTYQKEYKQNNNTHFSSAEEMKEFYEDGIQILDWIKKKRGHYFSKRGWHLIGCELPLIITPNKAYKNVIYKGFLDLVLYHEDLDEFTIFDIKTSTYSWGDKQKKNEIKQAQLLLYKKFFSEQFGVDIDKIKIEFFIVKRKLNEESEYPQKRVQQYVPAHGTSKINKAKNALDEFINKCFKTDETFKDTSHEPNPGKHCDWCPFNNKQCPLR